ncbi:hypothetical protein MKX03_001549 [Papaver bracteatum]|nr:hypothetical protein MKX03_001549 [Papaver bracteatum]
MAKVYNLVLGILGLRNRMHSLTTILVVTFIVLIVYMKGKSTWLVFEDILTTSTTTLKDYRESVSLTSSCDLSSGKWVYDNSTYPLYSEKQCSFMFDEVACEKFGRKDLSYQNWRWQPNQCDLPRFNAKALLERLRGKRMVYVGDSLNRNQWLSMVCLVESVIPSELKSVNGSGSLRIFNAIEYNATIEFYWSPLLVESNSDDPSTHHWPEKIVRAQAIEKHAIHWMDADILVFNSYLWWRSRPKMKVLWGSFEHPNEGTYKEVEMLRSYEMALKTWSDWLEIHVNHTKTELLFVGMSPTHSRAEDWSTNKEGNCYNETKLISRKNYKGGDSDPKMINVLEKTLDELKVRGVNVKILNITQLSEYRKEGHPSIYRKQWNPLTREQISNPTSYSDCIHWCLPGVPDTWNELLYAYIFS